MSTPLLFALRRHWKVLVALPILAAIAVAVFVPPGAHVTKYTARETVAADLKHGRGNFAQIQQSVFLVRQNQIATAAAKKLGLDRKPAGFTDRIQVQTDTVSYTVGFSAKGRTAQSTEAYVDAFAQAYVDVLNGQGDRALAKTTQDADAAITAQRARVELYRQQHAIQLLPKNPDPTVVATLNELQNELDTLVANRSQTIDDASNEQLRYRALGVERAKAIRPSRLNLPAGRPARASIAFLLALALAGILVAVLERLSPRIINRDGAEEVSGAPVLAMVPTLSPRRRRQVERVRPAAFVGPFAEAYRGLRSHLDFLDVAPGEAATAASAGKGSIIVIVSPTPGDGKSITSAYLSMALAESDRKVLLLGCDFRRPKVHEHFELAGNPGFTTRRADPGTAVGELIQHDAESGVDVIASGPSTARTTDLLPEVRVVAETARAAGRTVVIDTAPLLVANEALELATMADRIVLVVRAGQTLERSAREAVTALRLNNSVISGVVLIGSHEASEASYYYYSYYREKTGEPTEPVTVS